MNKETMNVSNFEDNVIELKETNGGPSKQRGNAKTSPSGEQARYGHRLRIWQAQKLRDKKNIDWEKKLTFSSNFFSKSNYKNI